MLFFTPCLPTDDVKRGKAREYVGRTIEKNERYNGKTTLQLLTTSQRALQGLQGRDRVPSSYIFFRAE